MSETSEEEVFHDGSLESVGQPTSSSLLGMAE